MALIRVWRGRPRGLRELPPAVRNHETFQDCDVYLDRADLSVNGQYLRLRFDSTAEDAPTLSPVVYFARGTDGTWRRDAKPSLAQLLTGLEGPTSQPPEETGDEPIGIEAVMDSAIAGT